MSTGFQENVNPVGPEGSLSRTCTAMVKQCLHVCAFVCVFVCLLAKNIEKCFKQGSCVCMHDRGKPIPWCLCLSEFLSIGLKYQAGLVAKALKDIFNEKLSTESRNVFVPDTS